jgi:hypothetical protein
MFHEIDAHIIFKYLGVINNYPHITIIYFQLIYFIHDAFRFIFGYLYKKIIYLVIIFIGLLNYTFFDKVSRVP